MLQVPCVQEMEQYTRDDLLVKAGLTAEWHAA